jgi:hypothetical protein
MTTENVAGIVHPRRHCERSEAFQNLSAEAIWIASAKACHRAALRADPLARNDGARLTAAILQLAFQLRLRILAACSARALLHLFTPSKKEGAGKAGRRLAPAVRGKEMHTGGPQVEPGHPGLPCAMGYDLLRALLGETSSIAPVALRMFCGVSHRLVRTASAGLDASFGRQDHTTSPSAHVLAGFSTAGVCSPSRPCEGAVSAVSSRESHCSRSAP